MAGSKSGSLKATKTMKRKYGRDYYQRIGRLGGKTGRTGGFHHMMKNNPDRLLNIATAAGKLSQRGTERSAA